MSDSVTVAIPTHEEYKEKFLSMGFSEATFRHVVDAAKLIHLEKAIKYIAEHERREEIRQINYKKMLDFMRQKGESEEDISKFEFIYYMAQLGAAEYWLRIMKWIRTRNFIPGLKPKQAIDFLKQYDLDKKAVS